MFEERHQTLVESELPSEIIHAVGNYVQLCARIEKLVIKAILIVERLEGADLKTRAAKLSLLSASELISSLKTVSDSLDENHRWSKFFRELRPYLHRFVDNRHKVVHGVVTYETTLNVQYFDKKSQEVVFDEVDQETVIDMIAHADQTARALKCFCGEGV